MQHEPAAEADRSWSRVHAAFLHLQCANRPFWPLVSKYTIGACRHDEAPSTECHKNVECCATAVVRCRIHRCQYIGFNSRNFLGIGIKVIKSYIWNIISWILSTTIPSRNVREVCPVWCIRIPLREILRMFVTRNIGIINYCNDLNI